MNAYRTYQTLLQHKSLRTNPCNLRCSGNKCSINPVLYRIKNHIGKGHFGDVSIGVWKKSKAPPIEVAIKTLSSGTEHDDKVKFLQEAAIMAQFRHPNVVLLYGIVSEGSEARCMNLFRKSFEIIITHRSCL